MSAKRRSLSGGDSPSAGVKMARHEHSDDRGNGHANIRCLAACLRCRQRKLKCDGEIPKCGPCVKANAECLARDQISNRPVPRGYLEEMEGKVDLLERRNAELEAMLSSYRANPSRATSSREPFLDNLDVSASFGLKETGVPRSYLGGSSSNLYINGVRDSAMSFLGVEIDVSDMNPTEMDFPFAALLTTRRPDVPELPPREEANDMIREFFRGIHNFMPTLHRPTLAREMDRLYLDPLYKPRASTLVIVNGIFANVSVNRDSSFKELNQKAHVVYFQRLCPYLNEVFFHQIYKGELEVLQALNIVLLYLRVVKKPAAGWFTIELATALAVDMGLHRHPRKWMTVLPNPLEMEMRKRTFWCTVALSRSIANNLGRPSGLREIDCDVDLPALIDDENIDENGYRPQPPEKPCHFSPGVEVFKLARITGHINELLYAPNRPDRKSYVTIVEQLENALQSWLNDVPSYLRYDPTHPENIAGSTLMQAYHECRILIRHPSLDLAPSPPFALASLDICVKSSYEMINLIEQNRACGYLDFTWPSIQKLMLATLTILYGLWQRRDKAERKDFRQVRDQMNICMRIMRDLGQRLGSAKRLGETIHRLVEATFRSMTPSVSRSSHKPVPKVPIPPSSPQQSLLQPHSSQYLPTPPSPYRGAHGPSLSGITVGAYSPSSENGIWWNMNWNEYMRSVAPDLGNLGELGFDQLGTGDDYFAFSSIPDPNGENWAYAESI